MEKLPLDKGAIFRLIEERFPRKKGAFLSRAGVHATTLTRWLEGDHYPRPDRFLRLCGALDSDFFAILDTSDDQIGALSYKIVESALSGTWNHTYPTLAFLQEFLLAPGEWPSNSVLPHYSRVRARAWSTWDYVHDPAAAPSERYVTFQLKPSADPQVWYFAFQEPQGMAWMWFRYGVVRRRWDEVLLLNFVFMGQVDRVHPPPEADSVIVQTYLPARPTTYRIASLHPFEATVLDAPPDSTPNVQFRQPGV